MFGKMTEGKLEKQIRDWAVSLGFKMPDGSLPPPGFFALLTATPNRCELWKNLTEKIQPKDKVKLMRSQLLASQLKHTNINSINKLDLLKKEAALKAQIKERRELCTSVEKNLISKASDLLFEICRMAELEKIGDEYKEKTLVLKLLMQREKKLMSKLEELLLRITGSSQRESFLTKPLDLEKEFASTEELSSACVTAGQCQSPGKCSLLKRIKDICDSTTTEQKLWEEVIKFKKLFLEKFNGFLESLKAVTNLNSDEEDKSENTLRLSINTLKQEVTTASLQALVNEADGQLLVREINNVLEKVEDGGASRHQSLSFILSKTLNSFCGDGEESVYKIREHLNNVGLSKYQEFLKEEVAKLEEECKKAEEEVKDFEEVKVKYRKTVDSCVSVRDEIFKEISKEEEQTGDIMQNKEEILKSMRILNSKVKDPNVINEIEETFGKLKSSAGQQVKLYIDTPLDAFRVVESITGEQHFEFESLQRCLNNYGGELKQLFRSILISPCQDVESILEEVKNRKKLVEDTTKFVEESVKLSLVHKELLIKITTLNQTYSDWDTHYNESDKILTKAVLRADDVDRKMIFVGKILKSWLEQPYRHMVNNLETYKGAKVKEVIKEELEEDCRD